jgi:hypothetical protein
MVSPAQVLLEQVRVTPIRLRACGAFDAACLSPFSSFWVARTNVTQVIFL